MVRTRRQLLRTMAAGGAVGAVAGCLGDSSGSQAETTDAPTDTPTPQPTDGGMESDHTVAVAEHDEHGEILVDSEGMTLYLFTQDSPGESACYDGCADNWPPLTVEDSPTAPDSLSGDLSTIERDDGSMQVTYNGWPLYYWVQDEEPGDATGHGVNDVWFVVPPDQEPLSADHTIGVADHDEHGEILVDSEGMTLYLFTDDSANESTCYDGCADNWPPLTVEDAPSAPSGLPGTIGTTDREDGSKQVTYNKWPLYYWVQDQEPGDATGHGVGDVWFVVSPAEEPPEGSDGTTKGGETADGSGGYGGDY